MTAAGVPAARVVGPARLPPPDAHARAAASRTGRALDADLPARAAAAWARLLGRPVAVTPAAPPPHGPPPSPGGLPFVSAGLELPDGRLARLDLDAHLLAGRLDALAGGPGDPVGPVPLSPAEEGLVAYLVLAWLALLPAPRPRLAWIHGGAPPWPVPAPEGGAVAWRIEIGGDVGGARWWLPPDPVESAPPRPDLPVPVRVLAGAVHLAEGPAPGDHLPVAGRVGLWAETTMISATSFRCGRFVVDPDAPEVPMTPALEHLPVRLEVRVAELTLTVAQLSALRPGDVLPLPVEPTPVVALIAGGQTVAVGVLVEAEGRLTVQVTRTA